MNSAVLTRPFEDFTHKADTLEKQYQILLDETRVLKERLREKDETIQRAARLSTLGQAAATVAHEIRNPLGAIQLMASLLNEEMEGKMHERKMLEAILKSANQIESFVSDILLFSKKQKVSLTPCDLIIIAEECVEMHRLLYSGEVSFSCEEELPRILGNEQSLKRIITNLLNNARKASGPNGKVEIVATSSGAKGILKIRDSGKGIPDSQFKEIFEPFVSHSGGTGLGLAIVKQLMDQHNGCIRVRNREEGGAEFTLEFESCTGQGVV